MEFNPDSTKQPKVLFSCKTNSPVHPGLVFTAIAVTKVDKHKHMGLTLQCKLSFGRHLNDKIIGILKHISKFLYKSLVRSHLDFFDIIYHMPQIVHHPPFGVSLHELMESVEKYSTRPA